MNAHSRKELAAIIDQLTDAIEFVDLQVSEDLDSDLIAANLESARMLLSYILKHEAAGL